MSHPEQAGIRVLQISKTFAAVRSVLALDDITFEVPRGQFVSVLGPSGCGKSTLLRIMAGLLTPDPGGRIEMLGREQTSPSEGVGVVFQTHNMLPWRTVEQNLQLAAAVQGLAQDEIDARVNKILPVLKLDGFRSHYPHHLSGGMRQRAAIGQILVLQPEVLLMDEPFGALDALTRDQLNVELLRLWQEMRKTVVLITHSIPEAVFLSDRVVVMSDRPGRILEDVVVSLPRPRDSQATKQDPEFGRYVVHLQRLMGVA
jgi:NitT/TauT family transport system ATP-binding protein